MNIEGQSYSGGVASAPAVTILITAEIDYNADKMDVDAIRGLSYGRASALDKR